MVAICLGNMCPLFFAKELQNDQIVRAFPVQPFSDHQTNFQSVSGFGSAIIKSFMYFS